MSREIEARLKLTARNSTASAFAQVTGQMRQVAGVAGQVNAQIKQQNAIYAQQALSMVAAVSATVGLTRQILEASKAAAALEKEYSSIAKTAGITTAQAEKLGLSIGDAAGRTGRMVGEQLVGVKALVAAGIEAKDAFELAPTQATIANATDATIDDIAKSNAALMQNLQIASSEILATWDKIGEATKAGSFEARDIAQYLPAVSASAAKLGIVGADGAAKLAAALQVTRTATGDASTAANNLVNLMEKIYSPDTKKNIDKHLGPRAWKSFEAGIKSGKDDLTSFIDMMKEFTKGDATKLPALIPDAQARSAISALITKFEMYDSILRRARGAQGTILKDAEAQANLAASAFERLAAAADTFQTRMGQKANIIASPVVDAAAKTLTSANTTDTLIQDYQDEIEKRTGKRPSSTDVLRRFMSTPLGGDGSPEGNRDAARKAAASDAYDSIVFGLDDPTKALDTIKERQARIAKLQLELDRATKAEEKVARLDPQNPARILAEREGARAKAQSRLDAEIIKQFPRLPTLPEGMYATPDEVTAKRYQEYGRSRTQTSGAIPVVPMPRPRPAPASLPKTSTPSLPADEGMMLGVPAPSRGAPEAGQNPVLDPSDFGASAMDGAARQATTAAAEVRALFDELRKVTDAASGIGPAIGSADIGGAVSQSMSGGVDSMRTEGQRMETEAQATMERIRRIFSDPISVNVRINAPPAAGLNRGGDVAGNGMAGAP